MTVLLPWKLGMATPVSMVDWSDHRSWPPQHGWGDMSMSQWESFKDCSLLPTPLWLWRAQTGDTRLAWGLKVQKRDSQSTCQIEDSSDSWSLLGDD